MSRQREPLFDDTVFNTIPACAPNNRAKPTKQPSCQTLFQRKSYWV